MTTITRTRVSVTRDDLAAQGLWSFYDDLESAGHDVRIVDADPMDRHLLVLASDGSAFKLTGYGTDDLTLRRYEDHAAYDRDDEPRAALAALSEYLVLGVLDATKAA